MSTREYFTTQTIGRTRSLTPEGFLLATGVPVARTGVQWYCDADGLPSKIKSDSQGLIRVHRDPEEVFRPSTIASFNGKSVTNDHPPEKINPQNWKDHSVGVVINPRRGDGKEFDNDFLYADLLITDHQAIKDLLDGKREISAGYDADYESIRPGEARQTNIVGNHVALVDKGRCGPRCAIGDQQSAIGDQQMARKQPAWMDRIMTAFKTQDEGKLVSECDKIKEMLGEVWLGLENDGNSGYSKVPGRAKDADKEDKWEKEDDDKEDKETKDVASIIRDAINTHMTTFDSRIGSLERAIAILATHDADMEEKESKEEKKEEKEETKDEDKKDDEKEDKEDDKDKSTKDHRSTVGDSTSLKMQWQELITRAEFLAPGIKHPTFDTKTSAKVTTDTMCKFRRKVLDEAMKEDDSKTAIMQIAGEKPKLAQMTCDAISMIFNGSSELMRQSNARQTKPSDGLNYNMAGLNSVTDVVRDINKSNKEFWAKR